MISLLRRTSYLLKKSPLIHEDAVLQLIFIKYFHTNRQPLCVNSKRQLPAVAHRFNAVEEKEKEAFLDVIRMYVKDTNNRTHIEFITVALKYMDIFGVNKDLESYKAILDVFPKGEYVPVNFYQTLFKHYPKQQDVALDLLHKMELNAVIPDREMESMLINIFGYHALPTKKYWRMSYWLPKFANLNPWPVPRPVPSDPRVLAQFAMEKVSSADLQSEITVFDTKDVENAIDHTWILSAMSKSQRQLLQVQPPNKSLYVEGPFRVWVANCTVEYFVLKGDPIKREVVEINTDDIHKLEWPFWNERQYKLPVTVHEQDDGTYYAMCATGISSKDSLLSWIRCLQKANPILEKIPITFKLKSSTEENVLLENENKNVTDRISDNREFLDKK